MSLYNALNSLNEDTCDLQFRELNDATAFIDEGSIVIYYEDEEDPETTSSPSNAPSDRSIPTTVVDTILPTIATSGPTNETAAEGEGVVRRYYNRRRRSLQTTQIASTPGIILV